MCPFGTWWNIRDEIDMLMALNQELLTGTWNRFHADKVRSVYMHLIWHNWDIDVLGKFSKKLLRSFFMYQLFFLFLRYYLKFCSGYLWECMFFSDTHIMQGFDIEFKKLLSSVLDFRWDLGNDLSCFSLPRYGAFDLGLAVSVPLPIVTGIFVLLWFQSRLT